MKPGLVFLSIFFFTPWIFSQESHIKFGKIDPAELAMKSYVPDSEANAVILSDIGLIKYDPLPNGKKLVRYHHVVIKILNQRGIDEYGNVEIPYYAHENSSYVANLKAMIHLPDGTEIKLKNENFREEKINEYYSRKKIAFPSVTEGAILEYEYSLYNDDIFNPVDWFFQGQTPIQYAELVVKIPDWFDYIILVQGNISLKGSRTKEKISGSDAVYNTSIYTTKEVPALKEENYITTMKDYYSRVIFRLNSVQFPLQLREDIMNTWDDISETLWDMPTFGFQLNNKRPGELVLEASGIIPGDSSQSFQKANQVYNYLNHNIEYSGDLSIGASMEIQEILRKRMAASGELNKLMLAALLQMGIEAYPVLISTRSNGHVFEGYPFVDQFDHMLVLAKLNGKDTWIDLGNTIRPMGYIAARSLNSRGWVAAKKNPYWVDLPVQASKSVLVLKGHLNPEGLFNGEMEAQYTGFHALNQRSDLENDSTEYFKEQLKYGNTFVQVTNIEVINEKEIDMPFQIKGQIKDLPLGDVGNNKIYISQVLLAELLDNPFKQEKREYPVEYNYTEDYTIVFDMILPENYKVESLPNSAKYTTEQNGVQASLQTSSFSDKIGLINKFAVKQLYFSSEDYLTLKNIYDIREEMFSDQLVLSKIP